MENEWEEIATEAKNKLKSMINEISTLLDMEKYITCCKELIQFDLQTKLFKLDLEKAQSYQDTI